MEKEDASYQTLEQLHERREQVVRMHFKGTKIMAIIAMSGLCYQAVRDTLDLFGQGGWAAISPASRGRERGQDRLLSDKQEHLVQRAIIDKRPEQLKLDFISVEPLGGGATDRTGVRP